VILPIGKQETFGVDINPKLHHLKTTNGFFPFITHDKYVYKTRNYYPALPQREKPMMYLY